MLFQLNQLGLEDEVENDLDSNLNENDEDDLRFHGHRPIMLDPANLVLKFRKYLDEQPQNAAPNAKRDTNRNRHAVPLSILDNIDTLRRGLMRELALRRLEQDRREMVKSSEDFKKMVGRK